MFETWLMGNNWTQEQWLIVSIIAFVVVAGLVILYRLYTIFKMTTKKRERPNLRVARRLRR
jgi:membrane protein DedA with SNARE-associated domain